MSLGPNSVCLCNSYDLTKMETSLNMIAYSLQCQLTLLKKPKWSKAVIGFLKQFPYIKSNKPT